MEEEIIEIIHDQMDQGERLNALADEFRRGRDARELLPLLLSNNAEVVSIVAWIFSELPQELYCADEFVSTLRDLTEHTDAMVRFHALSALYPFLDGGDSATQARLKKLMQDDNPGVRKVAEAAAARLGIK